MCRAIIPPFAMKRQPFFFVVARLVAGVENGCMNAKAQSRRAWIVLSLCLMVGTVFTLLFGGLAAVLDAFDTGPFVGLGWTGIVLVLSVLSGASLFVPYGFIVLGWLKLGDYDRKALDALGDDNTVGDPEAGERKYQQWISAVNSPEAYLGLVPRSADYVPPEQRPPVDAKLPRSRLSRSAWRVLAVVMAIGAIAGVGVGSTYGIVDANPEGPRVVPVLRLFACSMIGAFLAAPIAVALALAFGRIEDHDPESESADDDTGTGGSETA